MYIYRLIIKLNFKPYLGLELNLLNPRSDLKFNSLRV